MVSPSGKVIRLGKKKEGQGRPRLTKVIMDREGHKKQALIKASQLRQSKDDVVKKCS